MHVQAQFKIASMLECNATETTVSPHIDLAPFTSKPHPLDLAEFLHGDFVSDFAPAASILMPWLDDILQAVLMQFLLCQETQCT